MADTAPREGVIPPPIREVEHSHICLCILTNGRGAWDKCGQRVYNPDSPLCDGCDENHRGQPGYGIHGVDNKPDEHVRNG
jgi:hypothetical protein